MLLPTWLYCDQNASSFNILTHRTLKMAKSGLICFKYEYISPNGSYSRAQSLESLAPDSITCSYVLFQAYTAPLSTGLCCLFRIEIYLRTVPLVGTYSEKYNDLSITYLKKPIHGQLEFNSSWHFWLCIWVMWYLKLY